MVKSWQKVGEPSTIAIEYGKSFFRQKFVDHRDQEVEFSLFGSKSKPVLILPITKEKEVIAIRQFRAAANEVLIELPGGNADRDNESASDAAIRELREETGYAPGYVIRVQPRKLFFEPCSMAVSVQGFVALDCELAGEQKLDPEENIEIVKIPLKKWITLIQSQASDLKTVALTFKALPYLGVDLIGLNA